MSELFCGNCFFQLSDIAVPCSSCGVLEPKHRFASGLPKGSVLNGNFLVGRILGEPGGTGVTYLCKDLALDTRVAIKELFPQDAVQREEGGYVVEPFENKQREFSVQCSSFLNEARTIAKIKHPAVVNIRHYFSENKTAYFVMDYYPGQSLAQVLDEKGRLPYEITLDLLWPVLSGLREVHSNGILHRDIKPENIFITNDGRPVLLDFGNAKSREPGSGTALLGTSAHFAPPEQYGNAVAYMGAWTDIYAICALFYYCLSGSRPTDSRHRQADPESLLPLIEMGVNIPEVLIAVISRGMEISFDKRFQSVEELQLALKPLRPQVGQFIWTEALENNTFGTRMRSVAQAVQAGKGFPLQLSFQAALLQWFWLLGHRMMRLGAISGFFSAVALCLLAYDFGLWPFSMLLFVVNGAICGLLGITALYYHLDKWSKDQPVRTPEEITHATIALRSMEKIDYFLFARGFIVIVIFGAALFVRSNFDGGIKDQITLAIQLEQLRFNIQEYYTQHGGPPDTLEAIGFVFSPNDEIKSLRLYGTTVEVSLGLDAVQDKKLLLTMQAKTDGSIGWKCQNIDVPFHYLPVMCN